MTSAHENALLTAIEQLATHDHLCSIYESSEERFAVAIPFIRIGLDRGERCIYVADDGALDRVVVNWASEIVGENPTGEGLFKRAAERCARALPDEIDHFVEGDRLERA